MGSWGGVSRVRYTHETGSDAKRWVFWVFAGRFRGAAGFCLFFSFHLSVPACQLDIPLHHHCSSFVSGISHRPWVSALPLQVFFFPSFDSCISIRYIPFCIPIAISFLFFSILIPRPDFAVFFFFFFVGPLLSDGRGTK